MKNANKLKLIIQKFKAGFWNQLSSIVSAVVFSSSSERFDMSSFGNVNEAYSTEKKFQVK